MARLLKFSSFLVAALLLAGCTAKHYRKRADKEVYNIIRDKQTEVYGQTNAFSIDTRYSGRQPKDISAQEIIEDRMREAREVLTLPQALQLALENNRAYQLRKENLYLSALTLSRERWAYVPQFFAGTTVEGGRSASGDKYVSAANRFGLDTLFKTGGRVSLDIANDLLRFYTGNGRRDTASPPSASASPNRSCAARERESPPKILPRPSAT